jgi:hypothetical protein
MLKSVRRERFRSSLFAALGAWVLAAALAHGAGPPLPPPCTTPPPSGPIQVNGSAALDRLGHAVAFGDVDGDGTADLIVGAPIGTRAKSGSIDRPGYVRVYDGTDPTRVLYTFTGDAAGDQFGWRVASGDVDGDGQADVVVAAPRRETSRGLEDQGRIWIFSGATGALIRHIDGLTKTEQLGESLALSDVTGDGKAELLAGAWSYDPGSGGGTNKNNGIVRLYDVATGDVLFEWVGTERDEGIQDEMGRAVAFGDVDGDGELDLILGAGGGPGYVEVISGADRSTRLHLFRGF